MSLSIINNNLQFQINMYAKMFANIDDCLVKLGF